VIRRRCAFAHQGSFTVQRSLVIATLGLLIPAAAAAQTPKSKLAVLPTQFDESAKGKVPKLFDDYLLTAVQNAGGYDVVGQEDINAMLGFEKQKDLIGCDDSSCLTQIGGALGVDKLVAVKVAVVEGDWVTTAKIINIREARVEARSSEFIAGDVKALLRAVPAIVAKLFAGGGNATPTPGPAAEGVSALGGGRRPEVPGIQGTMSGPLAPVARTPDTSVGRGARITGAVLYLSGLALAAGGVVYALVTDTAGTDASGNPAPDQGQSAAVAMLVITGPGLLLSGIGSGVYMNGVARMATGDSGASGHSGLSWLGWTSFSLTCVLPLFGLVASSRKFALETLIGGSLLSTSMFAVRMFSSLEVRTSDGARGPIAQFMLLKDRDGRPLPAMGLTYAF
jgi:hypothetical protein